MKHLEHDPVVVAYARTPIGKYAGILSHIRPDDMLAHMLSKLISGNSINVEDIDEVIIGCANQAGEDNRNIARMAVLLAKMPHSISAITLNRLCASGLDAIIDGARRIIVGEAQLIIAGGVESMSRAPYVIEKPSSSFKLGAPQVHDSSLGWRFFNDKMREHTPPEPNGVTAERLAEHYKIDRIKQDEFALLSHQRSVTSQKNGFFKEEIIPIDGRDTDEGPRMDTSMEKLSSLKAAFVQHGSVTAGNSSSLNDGACVVALCSHQYAKDHGLIPKARIVGFASAGVDPKIMGIGPVPATHKLMRQCGLSINDFSALEINEAFAAQVLSVIDVLQIDPDKVNQRGGAIALGHPLGCSGARIVATLIHHLNQSSGGLGLATLCVGVGQGVSLAVEAL